MRSYQQKNEISFHKIIDDIEKEGQTEGLTDLIMTICRRLEVEENIEIIELIKQINKVKIIDRIDKVLEKTKEVYEWQ